jgi:ribosomal protein L37AE/L43A
MHVYCVICGAFKELNEDSIWECKECGRKEKVDSWDIRPEKDEEKNK